MSKVDLWLGVLLCLPPSASIAMVVALVLEGRVSELPLAAVIALLVAVVYVAVVLPVACGLDGTHRIVRHGLLRRPIGLGDILSVELARTP